ncbi:hypothetical protein MTO96_004908 [Rhipicephalus appendiculatus]
MQQGSVIKPVQFLTRKKVFPLAIEVMNVHRAFQVFSPEVTAALKLLQEQAGHKSDISFAEAGPTIEFMDTMHRWFVLMDLVCMKFCKPVFTNYALGVTDKHDVRKALYHKPLSRKVLKL